jgi:hypothetical protein
MLKPTNRWTIALAVVVLMLLGGSPATAADSKVSGPIIEPQDSGVTRITLTDLHVKRLGIQFTEVKNIEGRLQAPYSVIVYDNSGGEWVYVNPKPNVFVRNSVKVKFVEGNKAYFVKAPKPGTRLVTSGAAELLGIECGVGEKTTKLSSLCY